MDDTCHGDNNPCAPGSLCELDMIHGTAQCSQCPTGYEGKTCHDDINECDTSRSCFKLLLKAVTDDWSMSRV